MQGATTDNMLITRSFSGLYVIYTNSVSLHSLDAPVQAANKVMHNVGSGVEYIGNQVPVDHPFGGIKPKVAGSPQKCDQHQRAAVPPWDEIRQGVSYRDQYQAYVASWFMLAAAVGQEVMPLSAGSSLPRPEKNDMQGYDGVMAADETKASEQSLHQKYCRSSCTDVSGYSPADIYRLHVVMFILSDLVRLVVDSVEEDGRKTKALEDSARTAEERLQGRAGSRASASSKQRTG